MSKDELSAMIMVAYELLTDHGLALPLFASSSSANALHVAVPSRPGDPSTHIADFELYTPTATEFLDTPLHRMIPVGATWTDIFVWNGVVRVGTRAELWESTEPEHGEMAREAPLTLLALADGADRGAAARCAALAHEWLARRWGAEMADRWQVDSYLGRLARRDVTRHLNTRFKVATVRTVLQSLRLVRRQTVLELRSPRLADFGATDLPDLSFAADALGLRLEIAFDPATDAPAPASASTREMVMRLRHGRGRTQTQIPLRVFDTFFGGNPNLREMATGRARKMTLSTTRGARNTMKLQLPEIAAMSDPVAIFERGHDGMQFAVYDSGAPHGRRIAHLLEVGLGDGSTVKTRRGATWWRVLSKPE